MPKLAPISFLKAAAAALAASGLAAAQAVEVETLIEFTPGVFLENLAQVPDGSTVFTSYFDKRLIGLSADDKAWTVADLPYHPVGVAAYGDGFIVTAHGAPFTDFPGFTETNRVLVLDALGAVTKDIPAPEARFLNGVEPLGDGRYAIADSIAGTVWTFRPEDDALKPFIEHELLTPDPAAPSFRPGANGVKLQGGKLYVSNSSRGAIYTFDAAANKPAKTLKTFTSPGPIDDFAFAADGSIFAATHGDALLKISADGAAAPVIAQGCDGCTSVAIRPDGSLIVLTTGGLLEGRGAPARVLRVRPAAY